MADPGKPLRTRRGATSEARERQLIALAVNLAEQQLRDGTASAQVITHYLKMSSSREKLEQKRLELENSLTEAKTNQIANQETSEQLHKDALAAMRKYNGQPPEQEETGHDD